MRIDIRRIGFYACALLGMGVLFYSAQEYFDLMRGSRIDASFCTISSYWNCDRAALSKVGSWQSIPLGLFGVAFFGILALCAGFLRLSIQYRRLILVFGAAFSLFLAYFLIIHLKTGCLVCYFSYAMIWACLLLGWNGNLEVASMKRSHGFILLAVFLGILAGYGLYQRLAIDRALPAKEEITKWVNSLTQMEEPKLSPFVKGASEPAYSIIEFSDFGCPYCEKTASLVVPYLLSRPDVRLSFYPYPLDGACNPESRTVHPQSCAWSKVALCAQRQDAFWKTHDAIFALARDEGELPPVSEAIHKMPVADLKALETCYQDPQVDDELRKLVQVGNEAKIDGTPAFIINGKKVIRFIPVPLWAALLSEIPPLKGAR